MYMYEMAVKSSRVRDHFSEIVDEVIREAPKVVNRRRDHFVMMNFEQLAAIASFIKFHVELKKDDDGTFIASSNELEDMFSYGDTDIEALHTLAEDMVEYSKEYLGDSFKLYFNAPNRKKHFPYVLKVMMQKSLQDVQSLFNVEYKRA